MDCKMEKIIVAIYVVGFAITVLVFLFDD